MSVQRTMGFTAFLMTAMVGATALRAQNTAPPPSPQPPPTVPPAPSPAAPEVVAPAGFVALFNGKDLAGWKGLVESPPKRAAMSPAELAAKQQLADARAKEHWTIENGELHYDGKGDNLCTAEDFTDFELFVDWKITPGGDSGIYMRGSPQANIWDNPEGSGALYNNEHHDRIALIHADRPPGEWNTFRIIMTGERVSVWCNGLLVVDDAVLENYWERGKPIYPTGAIELQNHGTPLAFKNIFVRRLTAAPRPAGALVRDNDRVAITGDSITEQRLYSRYIEDYLLMCAPVHGVRCMQFGWSGERATGLEARLANDVLAWKPTVVTTCYGMNDAMYRPFEPVIGQTYADAMAGVVKGLKAAGARVIVGSPGAVDLVTFKPLPPSVYNDSLAKLGDLGRELAFKEGLGYANVHDRMIVPQRLARPKLGEAYDVCGTDGIHPRANGHLLMAHAFLRAMAFEGPIARITMDMNGATTASAGHTVTGGDKGVATIESVRYPFCFPPGDEGPDSLRSILPYTTFNQDLNQFVLVCTNLGAPKARVSWNDKSKVFTKEQLEAGVNLAAEFLDNPFSEAFARVDKQVAVKQQVETELIKGAITHFRAARNLLGDDAEGQKALDTAAGRLWARTDRLHAEATALIQPVKHTIKVEPQP